MSDELDIIRRRLKRRQRKLDNDVDSGKHGYDSALFLAAKAGGFQDAIEIIDQVRKPKGRKINLDQSGEAGSVVTTKRAGRQHRPG